MEHANSSMLYFYDLQVLITNVWKYGMLSVSLLLLFVAFIILTCQLCRCWKPNKLRQETALADEVRKGRRLENGFWLKRFSTSHLGSTCHPSLEVKAQKEEFKKFHACFSPCLARSYNMDIWAPDQTQGKLRFSLLYKRDCLELLLTVLEVLDLPNQECSHLFVQVRLLSWACSQSPHFQHILHEWQTQVVQNSSSPTFGDQCTFRIQEAELTSTYVKLEVKHFDKYSQHVPLGEVRIALNTLNSSESLEFCEELQRATKDTVGEVLVSLKCLPISQRIEVGLLKVKASSLLNSLEKRIFARVNVFYHFHKQQHQKSKARTLAPVTTFNETFLFHLPGPVMWDYAVLIAVFEVHPSSWRLIGQALLGSCRPNRMKVHGGGMMLSSQQPVAQWHPLLI